MPKQKSIFHFQGFVLDIKRRKLSNSDGEIKLGARAFDVLVELVKQQGIPVSKSYLMETVWPDMFVEENNINQAIGIIRKTLNDTGPTPNFIKTVSGRGYCFIASTDTDENKKQATIDPSVSNSSPKINFVELISSHQPITVGALVLGITLIVGAAFLLFKQDLRSEQMPAQAQSLNAQTTEEVDIIKDSVAVIPFSTMNQTDASDLFALGLHNELTTQLSKIKSLKVIARDRVVNLYQEGLPTLEIAKLLKAQSLIEGTILIQSDSARINMRMVDSQTGVVLWSDSLATDIDDISRMLAIQGQIALNVVNTLELEIKQPELESIAIQSTQSLKAYRYYFAARTAHKHQDEKEKWKLVQKALNLDPNYADAHRSYASINSALASHPLDGYTAKDHLRLMQQSTDAFIQLEPDKKTGYALKAFALGMQKDWEGAAKEVEKLEAMNASYGDMKYIGKLMMSLGDHAGAVKVYEDNLISEPTNLYLRGLLMIAYEIAGDHENAKREYAIGNELKPIWWGDNVNIFLALGRKEPLIGTHGVIGISLELTDALQNINDYNKVNQSIENYLDTGTKTATESIYFSALAAYIGNNKAANQLFRLSMDEVGTSIFWAWLPIFDDFRLTQDFKNILLDYGLVSYWQKHGWPEFCQANASSFTCQ